MVNSMSGYYIRTGRDGDMNVAECDHAKGFCIVCQLKCFVLFFTTFC